MLDPFYVKTLITFIILFLASLSFIKTFDSEDLHPSVVVTAVLVFIVSAFGVVGSVITLVWKW